MDWTATLLDLARAAMPPTHPLDGDSLTGYLLDGRPHEHRDLFWRMNGQAALRRGHLKYLRSDDAEHLFDLRKDVHEQADIAGDRPEVTTRLRDAWHKVNETLLPYE
jgi:arylsulfatase A-like enzyme